MKSVTTLGMLSLTLAVSQAQPVGFQDDFSGPTLDPAWIQGGDPANHTGILSGSYFMTDSRSANPDNGNQWGTQLRRVPGGTAGSFTSHIKVTLDPFRVAPSTGDTPDNTKTDFKFRHFGPDGFVEIVFNSFGDMRLFHRNAPAGLGGNLVANTNIGYTDGDVLDLTVAYDQGSDMIDVAYALNGGASTPFYSGAGNGGAFGDFYTQFTDVEMFKFGDTPADQAFAGIDMWEMVVPEPSSAALLGLGSLGLLLFRRGRGTPAA